MLTNSKTEGGKLSRAFTLIELLAVIVILAVISLIVVPVMLNVIERVRKGAFEDTSYGIIDAAKLYYADASLDKGVTGETFTFPNDTKLKLTGEKPKSGSVILEEDGKVSLAISNGVWCAKKGKEEEKVTIVDYSIGNCEIGETNPSTPETCFTVSDADPSEITGYTCEDTDIKIPDTINGIAIKEIGSEAFWEKELTSVVIAEGIESIGSYAFYCSQLTSVTIPDSVTSIGSYAFQMNQLTNVTIPKGVTNIEDGTFYSNQLISVIIPDSVTEIGYNAFSNNQLTSVVIPDSVTSIGKVAFSNNQLTNVVIPNGVTSIGTMAFNNNQLPDNQAFIYSRNDNGTENNKSVVGYGGKRRENVVIPSNVITIEFSAFQGNRITSITIPDSVTSIGSYAFSTNKLSSITIPESVTSIGSYAFSINELSSITIPDSVTSIGNWAFEYNAAGMKVTINKSKDSISGSPWGASSVEWIG